MDELTQAYRQFVRDVVSQGEVKTEAMLTRGIAILTSDPENEAWWRLVSAKALNDDFTGREWEVAQLIAAGKTNQEIAEALFIEPVTVRNHITSIRRKFDLGGDAVGRVQIARIVWERRGC